jgi:hypothetical protein
MTARRFPRADHDNSLPPRRTLPGSHRQRGMSVGSVVVAAVGATRAGAPTLGKTVGVSLGRSGEALRSQEVLGTTPTIPFADPL